MASTTPSSLVSLCQMTLLAELERSKFNSRMINDLCKWVPDQFLLEPIFEHLLSAHSITDMALIAYLGPCRLSLRINSAPHIRNSVFKLIGMNCPHLTALDLSDCGQVSNSVVRAILQGCSQLQQITLDRCRRITDSAFDFSGSPFEPLLGCLSLESISLQGCPQITGEVVQTLNKNCRSLTYLNLSQCKHIVAPRVQSLLFHNHLRVLNLAFIDNMSDDAFSVDLNASPSRVSSPLQILNLCKSKITDTSLQNLVQLRELMEIRLQWCVGITDVGVHALVTSCRKLRIIDLKSCCVTDRSLCSIAEQCHELRELDLSWCFAVTDAGLQCLVSASGTGSSLNKLSLVWCLQITDQSLAILCALPALKSVQLHGCTAVTSDGLRSLQLQGIEAIS